MSSSRFLHLPLGGDRLNTGNHAFSLENLEWHEAAPGKNWRQSSAFDNEICEGYAGVLRSMETLVERLYTNKGASKQKDGVLEGIES